MKLNDLNKEIPAVVILAAGKSDRMGTFKFALRFDDEHTFLEKIIKEYESFGCRQIILVLNKNGFEAVKRDKPAIFEKIKIVINNHPEFERFYSVKLGLKEIEQNIPVFIQNIDNPFIDKNLLTKLSEACRTAYNSDTNVEYYVPVYKSSGGHPVLLSPVAVGNIKAIKENDLNFRFVLRKFSRINIPVNDEKVLININTPEEYGKLV